MFMNQWDVEEARDYFAKDKVLAPATQYLYDFMQLINDISDGWAHWSHGRRCADALVKIIESAKMNRYRYDSNYVPPTRKDVVDACKKIERTILTNKYFIESHAKPPTLRDSVQLGLF